MTNTSHPDDELLSAFAAADRDATADRALTDHIAACDRCGPIVAELTLLRAALAELPDITPSRPLRLLPPVMEPERRRAASWLQRLVAPAIATGAGLVLVGAVGTAGLIGQVTLFFGAAAGAAPAAETSSSAAVDFAASTQPKTPGDGSTRGSSAAVVGSPPETRGGLDGGSPAAAVGSAPETGGSLDNNGTPPALDTSPDQPWSLVLIGGLALMGGGLVVRRTASDRDA